jgi:hypothetical protein
VDFTVYLPDEIGQRAKELPRGTLSQLFRTAVTDELERRDTMSETLSNPKEYEVTIEGESGVYTGRITGKEIAYQERGEVTVYLTDDNRVIAHDGEKLDYHVLEDPVDDLRDWLDDDAYAAALYALGEKPVIDL